MSRLWNRLRAFLRGPSSDSLFTTLDSIECQLVRLEAEYEAERERLMRDHPGLKFLAPPTTRRGLEG